MSIYSALHNVLQHARGVSDEEKLGFSQFWLNVALWIEGTILDSSRL